LYWRFLKVIEQQIQDVYDKAVNLEKLFLNFRLDILKKDPELLIKEVRKFGF